MAAPINKRQQHRRREVRNSLHSRRVITYQTSFNASSTISPQQCLLGLSGYDHKLCIVYLFWSDVFCIWKIVAEDEKVSLEQVFTVSRGKWNLLKVNNFLEWPIHNPLRKKLWKLCLPAVAAQIVITDHGMTVTKPRIKIVFIILENYKVYQNKVEVQRESCILLNIYFIMTGRSIYSKWMILIQQQPCTHNIFN